MLQARKANQRLRQSSVGNGPALGNQEPISKSQLKTTLTQSRNFISSRLNKNQDALLKAGTTEDAPASKKLIEKVKVLKHDGNQSYTISNDLLPMPASTRSRVHDLSTAQ